LWKSQTVGNFLFNPIWAVEGSKWAILLYWRAVAGAEFWCNYFSSAGISAKTCWRKPTASAQVSFFVLLKKAARRLYRQFAQPFSHHSANRPMGITASR